MLKTSRRVMLASSAMALINARAQAAFNAFSAAATTPIIPPPTISPPFLFLTAAAGTTHVTSGSPTTGTNFSCPANSTVVVLMNAQAAGSIATLVDLVGGVVTNTYSKAGQAVGGPSSHDCELWYCAHCLPLPAGSTFRATTVLGGTYTLSGAAYFTGADTLDRSVTLDTTTAGYTLSTPPLTTTNASIAFGANIDGGATSYTEDSNWTPLLGNPVTSFAAADFAYQIVNSTSPVTWTVAFAPSVIIDVVIATFKQGGGTIGTGLSAATAFLPSTLPQVPSGSNAAGGGFHLTARPWTALNIAASSYLARAKGEASYWSSHLNGSGDVINPYGTFDDDRGKTPNVIGIMATATPPDTSLVTNGVTMLNRAVVTYPTAGPDFFMQPMFDAIPLFATQVGNFGITSGTIAGWYTGMNNYFGIGNPNNFVAYDMVGLWSAHLDVVNHGATQLTNANFANATTNLNTIEGLWNQQLTVGGISGNGAYGDPPFYAYRDGTGPPDSMAVETLGRGNITAMMAAGYNGPSATSGLAGQPSLDFITKAGALTALLTQDPSGQGAAGGRQGNQNWTDAVAQLSHEIMAQKFVGSNTVLAGQFARAGQLTFNSIARWANPQLTGTFFVVKNHFDPSLNGGTGVGGQAGYQYTYNNDLGQFTALSYAQRIKSVVVEQPAPSEIGGFAFRLNSAGPGTLNYAFANAGGTNIEIALTGATFVQSGQYWTAPGFLRIGRAGWETRLGPHDAGYMQPNAVSFAPTWNPGAGWTRLAQNPSTVSGAFSTTFASPALVICQVVWTVSGGPTFTQNVTITPDGVMVQTSASGITAGNWGLTFPILTVDGTTSPNTWGATSTITDFGVADSHIASAKWQGSSSDSQNYMVISSNAVTMVQETNVQTQVGNVTPVRAFAAADTVQTTFVYPANSSDPSATSVRTSFVATGANTYTCSALGSSVVSDTTNGTYYIGSSCASGWAKTFTLSGGNVTFSAPCFFVAQLSNGVVTAIEVDRVVTATVQSNPPQLLAAYTPVTFGIPLPTGLLQSTPMVSTTWIFNQSGSGVANGDGTTGYSTFNGEGILQLWYNFPASQYYQFVVPAYSPSWNGGQANPIMLRIDQFPIQADSGNQTNLNYYTYFVSNPAPSQNYSFTAPVTAGWHSIQICLNYMNAQYTLSGATSNNLHADRINIIGTGTPLPAEPAGNRDPSKFPMSSWHFINTPFGANAQWLALNNPTAQVINGTGGNGANVAVSQATFSVNYWRGQTTDPVWLYFGHDDGQDNSNYPGPATSPSVQYPVRAPAGSYQSFGGDGAMATCDLTNPRYWYIGFGIFGLGDRTVVWGTFGTQDSYNINSASPQVFQGGTGTILVDDLDSGAIKHRLAGGLAAYTGASNVGYGHAQQTSQASGLPWPGCNSDHDWSAASGVNRYGNPVGPPYNSVIGIPPGIARPSGMSTATSMMWDCLQHYGLFLNVSAGNANTPTITIYAEGATQGHPLMNISWGTIIPNLSVMSSPAPIVINPANPQGYGGGNIMAGTSILPGLPQTGIANVSPGLQPGFPSLGLPPYTFPASPVGIPIQCGPSRIYSAISSGTTPTMGCNAANGVPIGSLVMVFMSFDVAQNTTVQFNGITDDATVGGTPNVYTIIQPPSLAAVNTTAIAYCLSTTRAIPAGAHWIATLNLLGQVNIFYLGAYYRPAPPSGLTSVRVSNTVRSSASVSTLSTSLAGVQAGDLIVYFTRTGGATSTAGYAEITQPAGFSELNPVPPLSIGFKVATAADAGTKTINPTFSASASAALTAIAFANANIAT